MKLLKKITKSLLIASSFMAEIWKFVCQNIQHSTKQTYICYHCLWNTEKLQNWKLKYLDVPLRILDSP